MLNALLRTVRTSSPRRYVFQARSITRLQRKENRLKNINKLPFRVEGRNFWDSETKIFSQSKIGSRTYEYTEGLFEPFLKQENHTFDEINKLWELVSTYEYIRFSDALELITVFEVNSKIDEAKSILRKIDYKDISRSDLIELGKRCATFDALDLIVEISHEFGKSVFNRPTILRVLEESTKILLDNKQEYKALDVYIRACLGVFRKHYITGSFYGQNYMDLYGLIIRKIKDLGYVIEAVQKSTIDHDIEIKKSIYYTTIRSLFYVERNTIRLQLLFDLIPEEFKDQNIVSYVFRSFLYYDKPKAAKSVATNYAVMLGSDDKATIQLYSSIAELSLGDLYDLFYKNLKTDTNEAFLVLKYAFKRLRREGNTELMEFMADKFAEESSDGLIFAYNQIMKHHLSQNNSEDFFKTFRKLASSKEEPNEESYSLLLKQFCRKKDLKSAFSLLDFMIEKNMSIDIEKLNDMVKVCSVLGDTQSAEKVDKVATLLKIERDSKFYSNMMAVYVSVNYYSQVEKVFESASVTPDSTMYSELIRMHLRKKTYKEAQQIFDMISKGDYELGEEFYFVMIEYFCNIKDFDSAEEALANIIKSPESFNLHKAFEKLMAGYNREQRYTEATQVFNKLISLEMNPSDNMLRLLLKSLTRTNFVNFGNYSRPKKIAEDIMSAYANKTLEPERKYLPVRIFRPLMKYLIDYYDPLEAAALLESYEIATKNDDKSKDLDYLKERIILGAKFKDWDTVNAVFTLLIQEFKYRFSSGDIPYRYRGSLVPVINQAAKSHSHFNQHQEFKALIDDLFRTRRFILNNRNMNDIAVILLENKKTFKSGLIMIEEKLMGGFIARAVMHGREWFESALPYGVPLPTYRNQITPPRLFLLNSSYMHVVMHLRLYLRTQSKAYETRDQKLQFLQEFKITYPKIFRNFHGTIIHAFPSLRNEILKFINMEDKIKASDVQVPEVTEV
ncbi:Pentatricopeptide repeat-containing protein [Wickerhamomyces ciferrii]|uniref:Mitochondrial 15S rRNA processing factor CCM1 n=1 Tax=Wickerhamomyces ciferrii (strain ATCC 14091 / BCRC 22168 / CBS 111 / JCM 3599 / NBRC 0793 / NRRL Y-1031 F-60-10) TaxID=1206466 RepID=K0K8S9_WICCF|nr:Pentatricopeptide repeat-containing protein [Wickerhamomyces ciferrii]CCH41250.1 Pentatricopeptide repeat-containing protein [Wickerhamomyces ciferrii]